MVSTTSPTPTSDLATAPDARGLLGQAITAAMGDLATRLQAGVVEVRGHEHSRGGNGSGTIWSADGLIITNHHVAPHDAATVRLSDGREFPARVVARNAARDLVALRIDAQDLPALEAGDPDSLRVGDLVLATGNPLGMRGVVTAGIIHRLGSVVNPMPDEQNPTAHGQRQRPAQRQRTPDGGWITADITLAPGNSGGPLTDAWGRVVGINAMVAGGLGLAVPTTAVQSLLAGSGQRAYLGIATTPIIRPATAGTDTAESPSAALLVLEVTAGSPAEVAGLLAGDIIMAIQDQPIAEPGDLAYWLHRTQPGETLRLEITRAGQARALGIVTGTKESATPTGVPA